jgi:hypothetical protein
MDDYDLLAALGKVPPRPPATADEHPDCPTCGKRMKSIMYGFPSRMPTEDDDYVLGGCTIFPGMPSFTCTTCAND